MKLQRSELFWILLSTAVYFGFSIYFAYLNRSGGFYEGGTFNSDSNLYYSYANELVRTGRAFLFQNPHGSLDSEPFLVNGTATFLRLFSVLYLPNLYLFDLILGAILNALCVFLIMKLLPSSTSWEKTFIFFGQGLMNFLVPFSAKRLEIVISNHWGLSFLLNQTITTGILQVFCFLLAVYFLIHKKTLGVLFTGIPLVIMQPFLAATFYIAVGFAGIFGYFKDRNAFNEYRGVVLAGILSALLFCFIYFFYLPNASVDAAFIKMVYEQIDFNIDPLLYLLSFLPALIFFGYYAIRARERTDLRLWIFVGTFIVIVIFNFSYLVTTLIPQPAHWNRVVPFLFLIGAGILLRSMNSLREPNFLKVLIVIAVLDGVLGLHWMAKASVQMPRPPYSLNHDQSQVLEKLKTLEPKMFLYVRDKNNTEIFSDFEFSIMTSTLQKSFYGHFFVSPERPRFKTELYASNESELKNILEKYGEQITYLILDNDVAKFVDQSKWTSQLDTPRLKLLSKTIVE